MNRKYNRNNKRPAIKERNNLATIPKTERTDVQVNEVITEDGNKHIDIRNWYTTEFDPDTPRPSQSGIWLPAEMAEYIGQALLDYASTQNKAKNQKEATTK